MGTLGSGDDNWQGRGGTIWIGGGVITIVIQTVVGIHDRVRRIARLKDNENRAG